MSRLDKCSICGDWDYAAAIMGRPHTCKPVWYCRTGDDTEDEATHIRAADAEDAACKHAQHLDSDGGYGDSQWTILVQSSDPDAPWVPYEVRGEPTIEYTATNLEREAL